MAIRVVDFPEPLSPASQRLSVDVPVIESDASRVLKAELLRYCRGELGGRSFLISGHRGAGKTTLVLNAFQQVHKQRETRNEVRPLLVQVTGPALCRDPTEGVRVPGGSPPDPAAARPTPGQLALKQIVLALHRAVAMEMCLAHRDRVLAGSAGGPEAAGLLELSAQLELELFECPMPVRLREFWRRAGLLERGVLFRGPDPERPDQGMRELVALAGVCEAYCRVSGTLTQAQKGSESAARAARASLAAKPGDAVTAITSLLAGGLVGVGLHAANAGGAAATLAGITAALGSAAVFKYSASRSSARSATREMSFMPDLSIATLDRFIPILVQRLQRAGLAPVFVVDELDKVPDLPRRMVRLLQELKKIFAETAFFVFITERRYFEELRRITSAGAYPPASTFFSHQLFVVYRPADLHRYLRYRLRPEGG